MEYKEYLEFFDLCKVEMKKKSKRRVNFKIYYTGDFSNDDFVNDPLYDFKTKKTFGGQEIKHLNKLLSDGVHALVKEHGIYKNKNFLEYKEKVVKVTKKYKVFSDAKPYFKNMWTHKHIDFNNEDCQIDVMNEIILNQLDIVSKIVNKYYRKPFNKNSIDNQDKIVNRKESYYKIGKDFIGFDLLNGLEDYMYLDKIGDDFFGVKGDILMLFKKYIFLIMIVKDTTFRKLDLNIKKEILSTIWEIR